RTRRRVIASRGATTLRRPQRRRLIGPVRDPTPSCGETRRWTSSSSTPSPNGRSMTKARLEAFSDGVFAIVITLLILDIRIPEVPYRQLWPALTAAGPRLLAYVMSFLLIGLYWVFHHHGMQRLERTDGVFIWLNILFLLFVSFLPFPTVLLGRY